MAPSLATLGEDERAELLEDAHYAPYLERQAAEIEELRRNEAIRISPDFPFAEVGGLSTEMVERLTAVSPENLADASRIRGVTPAALAAILVALKRRRAV
jgi:tRNA uridine 5-carboxymethylaminomethyl modification enzyme